ncbi:MAG: hypothetical protein GY915_03745 [bacterium]|nr:hypothetical protein [bacterium]
MTNKYKAQYRKSGEMIQTRYYRTKAEAQNMLAKRIGAFHHLGQVSGDIEENGLCESAPRNGGLVSIVEVEKPSQADLQGKLQEYILGRIAAKGFFFSRGNKDNRTINALQKKGLVKTEVHTTPSGQRIRKVVAK